MLTEACCTQGSRASREDPNVKTFLHRACGLIGVWGMVDFVLQVCSLCMCSHVGWLPMCGCCVQDTAGSERYESMSRIYYRGARAAIVCYGECAVGGGEGEGGECAVGGGEGEGGECAVGGGEGEGGECAVGGGEGERGECAVGGG